MTERQFDPSMALGEEIAGLGKQELCWMAAQLCRLIVGEVGNKSYRGGVWPENICYEGDGRFSLGEGHRSDWGKESFPKGGRVCPWPAALLRSERGQAPL